MKAIVLSFDRLAARILGCYGNAWIDTPHFDRLAAEGVVFDCCYAESICGGDALHAWFSGRYGGRPAVEAGERLALGEILRRAGVEARMIVEAGADDPGWEAAGFEVQRVEGRDGLDVPEEETPFAQLIAAAAAQLDDWAERGVENGLLWLKSRGVPRPWTPPREFAAEYVGLFEDEAEEDDVPADADAAGEIRTADESAPSDDEHAGDPGDEPGGEELEQPADPAELEADLEVEAAEFDQLLEALGRAGQGSPSRLTPGDWKLARAVYAGYVSLLDVWFGELRHVVAELGDDVLWIVTAAEGDALGERVGLGVPASSPAGSSSAERGSREHAAPAEALAEECAHLPLIVRLPGAEGGSRRQDLVQPVDIAPTLCEFLGVTGEHNAAPEYDGHSLLPTLARNEPVPRDAAFTTGRDAQAIRTADYWLVRSASGESRNEAALPPIDGPHLFVMPDDPWGICNVAAQSPAVVDELCARLDQFYSGGQTASSDA